MHYYEVALADRSLKIHQTLTYASEAELAVGSIVRITIRRRVRNGIIWKATSQPSYKTRTIDAVLNHQAIPAQLLALAEWMADYYAVELGTCIGLLLPSGAQKKRRPQAQSRAHASTKQPNQLTNDQKSVVDGILEQAQTHILRGVTGSGKTRVYIELAKHMRTNRKASIILVPEIGLTSQMVDEFIQYFDAEVFVVHSAQTEAQRHGQWLAIQAADCPIVIGPRSALFSPITELGLIVIDEEHDSSYKQDVSPKYDAARVAGKLRALCDAQLVLGSATPSVVDVYQAERVGGSVLTLLKTVKPQHETKVVTVDIKKRDQFTQDRWLSDQLITAIRDTLANQKQSLLFHNRRGTSTSVICRNCGWVGLCPNCDLPLTHHADWAKLVCHICNHRHPVPASCPSCKSADLVYQGAGTKEIVSAARKLFPDARIERFDSDITQKDERLEERYESLVAGDVDIIVGTQMVAKGLDLPKLSTVGVVLADTALYLPDYSSNERTYQLITQVIGRSGRHQDGQVIIQTYQPDNASIVFAMNRNWPEFYAAEIADRKIGNYPPHIFMLKLSYEHTSDDVARGDSQNFAKQLRKQLSGVEILGPSPAFHHKTRTGWRWQIVIKAANRRKLTNIAKQLPDKWQFEIDPSDLL